MKFKVPIGLKDRKRYICVHAPVSMDELNEVIKRRLREISGIKGAGVYRFSLLSIGESSFIVKTTESAAAALLTALLIIRYENIPSLEVGRISGTLRKARELCVFPQYDG